MGLIAFDSIEKIRQYMVMLSLEPDGDFTPPKYLGVSKTFWRDYTCPDRPFSCKFELNKFSFNVKFDRCLISKRLFGRGWQYKRVDGGIGAKCEMLELTEDILEIVYNRDVNYIRRLVFLLDKYKVNHRGHQLLDLLEDQYLTLKRGDDIKQVTVLGNKKSVYEVTLI